MKVIFSLSADDPSLPMPVATWHEGVQGAAPVLLLPEGGGRALDRGGGQRRRL